MLAITCALIAAAVLSMLFASTRKIGIISVALLCLLFPIPVLALVLIVIGTYNYLTHVKAI